MANPSQVRRKRISQSLEYVAAIVPIQNPSQASTSEQSEIVSSVIHIQSHAMVSIGLHTLYIECCFQFSFR